jgi:uncharacterized 2Fe-2S/4Fe-4S cluster protein (DUF4445 family)
MTEKYTVVLLPSGRRGQVPDGTSLRAAARGLGVDIESICAENATCGKCKVLLEEGEFPEHGITSRHANLSPPGAEESEYFAERTGLLAGRGWKVEQVRLACQAKVHGDVLITVPDESLANKQIVRKSARVRSIEIRPAIRKYLVELNPPTLSDPKADWERLASGIATSIELVRYGEPDLPRAGDLSIDYACLRSLPEALRASQWRVTVSVWQDREVIRVEPGYTELVYGGAVDIGTTTVALYLCNLASGEIVAAESALNSQVTHGEDVMSRIHYSSSEPDGLENLHKAIIKTLNQLLNRAAKSAGISLDDILELVVAGNSTMNHFFLDLAPRHLGMAPFVPAIYRSLDIKARELQLAINKSANVHILPAIASFIGADTTAVLLAEEPHEQDEMWLIIDIGTNAELVLGNRHRLMCASTPTGPAFEGAHIEYGMRASPGAIEHLQIDQHSLKPRWKIIGQEEWNTGRPKGLCGSAVIDAVAELLRAGALDASGKFLPGASDAGRIRRNGKGIEYIIAYADETDIGRDLCLTQQDVRQIQLAKGALFVAAQSLLRQFGLQAPDKILLAGAFGTYINKANAMYIGMIPEMPLDSVFVVGNSAGDGARIALLNVEKRGQASQVAARLTRHELPTDPDFQTSFVQAMGFPNVPPTGRTR